jgi:catechol 2,3-dioxygenase-like lactoylglutathione lyase family enzyme
MIRGIHHVGIVTSSMERTLVRFSEVFGCDAPNIRSLNTPNLQFRTALVNIGSGYVQMIEPQVGYGTEELATHGEGAIIELALEVSDIGAFHRHLKRQGVIPVDIFGQPIPSNFLTASSGSKFFYLPKDVTAGTRIEIYEPIRRSN